MGKVMFAEARKNDGLYGTGILLEEPNSARSRPRDRIELYQQQRKPQPPTHTRGQQARKGKATETAQR